MDTNERSGYRNGQLIYPISVVDHKPKEEGGGGGTLGPDTVGSQEIIDNSVKMVDLNTEVKDKLKNEYDSDNETLYLNGSKPKV
jgi:hypothetical protein